MRRSTARWRMRTLVPAGLVSLGCATASLAQETASSEVLTLSEAVALAHETHPSVGAARAGEDAASSVLGQARSAWWPQLGTRAGVVRYQEPMVVAPIHGFTQEEFERIEFERTLIQGNASLTWTVFDGGARLNSIRGAQAGAAGAAAARAMTEMALTARVTLAYLEVLTARGVLDAQQRRLDALQAERQRVDQLLAEGQAARVELLRVDAALAEAEAQRVATATRLDLAERQLARLIGVEPSEARVDRLCPIELMRSSMLEQRADLVERAKANNPDLERARQSVAAAEAKRKVARAAWIPVLELAGGYQLFSSDAGNTSTEWNVGIAVTYPLFTGGARSSAVSQASAETYVAHEELRLAELEIEDGVDRALNAALETEALVSALRRAVQHQTEVVRIEQLSLEAGAGTQTDYLRAEADLARARSLLVEAQHAEIAARAELARVVGELTPEWLVNNVEISQ
ncbi:MAG: TolC family protein [Gemmatimonadota bacterium]|nr:MAG: TolC family protein [Gemmatimonadota bacterium]